MCEERAICAVSIFRAGFTVIELVIVLVVLAILSAFVVPKTTNMIGNTRVKKTESEMYELKRAIIGDADAHYYGYRDNMGDLPASLNNLITNPNIAGLTSFNVHTQMGWNGPYVDDIDRDGSGTADILEDGWGNAYIYNQGAATLTSRGQDNAAGGSGFAADIVINLD